MQSKHVKTIINLLLYIVGVLLICIFVPKILRFFMPFVIGWILALIANPLVKFFEKRLRIVRKHSSLIIIVGVLALVIFGVYSAAAFALREGMGFLKHLPGAYSAMMQGFHEIETNLSGLTVHLSPEVNESIQEFFVNIDTYIGGLIAKIGMPTLSAAGDIAMNLPNLLLMTIFTLLSAFFFISDREKIMKVVRNVLPQDFREKCAWVKNIFSSAVGGYFRAQFKIMGVVAAILWIGFMILGVDYAVLWALLIAMLDFLPFLGTGTAIWPWAAFQLLTGDYYMAAGLMIIYLVTQLVRQVIQPKILGDTIGIDPLSTLIFMFIGYRISSVFGMIIAIPIGIILIQLFKAGAFDKLLGDVKSMLDDFNRYRKS